jgi:hypothetical protein
VDRNRNRTLETVGSIPHQLHFLSIDSGVIAAPPLMLHCQGVETQVAGTVLGVNFAT